MLDPVQDLLMWFTLMVMIAAAMIPEAATHSSPNLVGFSPLAGFLAAILFKLLG